jgi:site-specific recombinase XerD
LIRVRASEIATLKLDYFNPQQKILAILGKGDRYRLIELEIKTIHLLQLYIRNYRLTPKPQYQQRLFINQRREELTRHGIYRICKKYLSVALPQKRLKIINPGLNHKARNICMAANFKVPALSIYSENYPSLLIHLF